MAAKNASGLFGSSRFWFFPGALIVFAVLLLMPPPAFGRDPSRRSGGAPYGQIRERGLVVLVTFPDIKRKVDRDLVQTRFAQHLNNYVREMSYNKVILDVDVTKKWYELPEPVSRYRISARNLEVDKSRVRKLIDDSLDAADDDVDFSRYSFTAVLMAAEFNEYGMIGLCGYPGMLGWGTDDVLKTRNGEAVRGGVAIFSFQAHLGTLFHDVAHILGGARDGKRRVPCLYDHDLQAKPGPLRETFLASIINLGFWDPMSCHYYRRTSPPPGMSSWTKLRLNWIDESRIRTFGPGEGGDCVLGPLEDGSAETLAVKVPLSESTYYLIENRQPIGTYDATLPGSGVLIMYADDRVPECRHGKAPVKLIDADPSVPHLEGAAFDVGKRDRFEDSDSGVRIHIREKIGSAYRITVRR